MHKKCWWLSQEEGDHYKEIEVGSMIIFEWILEIWNGMVWTGLIWLRIGTIGGLFLSRCATADL
jgi:hypothetical protein